MGKPKFRKKPEFIPIENISPEDVAPGFFSDTPKTPEEILLAAEEERERVAALSDSEKKDERAILEEGVSKTESEETEAAEDEFEKMAYEQFKLDQDKKIEAQESFSFEKRAQDEEYQAHLKNIEEDLDNAQDDQEQIQALIEKYHWKSQTGKMDIQTIIGKHRKTGTSYGPWGRELKGKHKKGGDTIRRFGIDE